MRYKLNAVKITLSLITTVAFISGCYKNGDLITSPPLTRGNFELRSATEDRYIVTIDGKQFGDTLFNGHRLSNILVEKAPGAQHVIIRNAGDNTVLLDSMITLETPVFSYLLLQSDPAEKPVLFSGSDDESAPGADSVKLRFIYTDQNLPDSIKMRFYYIDGNTLEFERFDSVVVYKKHMGQFITGLVERYPGATLYAFDVLRASDGSTLQSLDLDPSSSRFAQGVMDQAPAPGGGILAKKQTLLLEFGDNSYLIGTYKDRYLFGSNE